MNPSAPRTACALDGALVYALLKSGRFDLSTEKATQADILVHLAGHIDAETLIRREHRLSATDIPDFLIGGSIVIEVKGSRHQRPAVLRQLERYAAHDCVQFLILATSRAMRMPDLIGGKPCRVLNLGRAWL